jgi:alkaline phosphatase D
MRQHRTWVSLLAILAGGLIWGCGDDDTTNRSDGSTPDALATDGAVSDAAVDAGSTDPGPEPPPWEPPGQEDITAFAWGVQSGDAVPEGVWLSVRTTESSLSLTVVRGVANGWDPETTRENLTPVDGVVQLYISGLVPDTTYSYAFYAPDGTQRSRPGRFRTALAPDQSRVIRFGGTHGLGGNLPWPSLSQASVEKLDFFMLLGDTIYADWGTNVGFENKFKEVLSAQGFNDISGSTSLIATWDDHEVENNYSYTTPGMDAKVVEALAAYRQAIPQDTGPGGLGVWRTLRWGQAMDVFVLDCRAERLNGNYISPEQMTWLKNELQTSTARFKIIINSVPITDFTAYFGSIEAADRWQGFPTQRSEILNHITDNAIGGVLWITGDFHIGGVVKIDAPGGASAEEWEVMVGPAGSPINSYAGIMSESDRLPVLVKQWSYTLFEADPDTGVVDITFIGDNGSTVDAWSLQL